MRFTTMNNAFFDRHDIETMVYRQANSSNLKASASELDAARSRLGAIGRRVQSGRGQWHRGWLKHATGDAIRGRRENGETRHTAAAQRCFINS
jgi:hypothetical protein